MPQTRVTIRLSPEDVKIMATIRQHLRPEKPFVTRADTLVNAG
jgi:hypothetical protein